MQSGETGQKNNDEGEKRGNSQMETDGGGFSLALGTSSGEGGCETSARMLHLFLLHICCPKNGKKGGKKITEFSF